MYSSTAAMKVKDEHPNETALWAVLWSVGSYPTVGGNIKSVVRNVPHTFLIFLSRAVADKINPHDDNDTYKIYIGRWFTGDAYGVGMERVRYIIVGGQTK